MEDSSPSFFKRHWEGWKDYWGERFSILDNYSKFVNRDKHIPELSDSDVEEFILLIPPMFAVAGAVIGAVSTVAVSWKYSRSPHGEFANHWLQLYRLDTLGAEVKFFGVRGTF
ncbi:hypothetical protein AAG906_005972 [Vitis piasezkii]